MTNLSHFSFDTPVAPSAFERTARQSSHRRKHPSGS
jgi:hypothetical protein